MALAALGGCAGTVAPVPPGAVAAGAPDEVADLPADAYPAQRLYRVRYDGPRGDGRLRLVLRLAGSEHFQLSARDTLGRALWDLELEGERLVLLDHREKLVCSGHGEWRIPELALSELRPAAVPRLLMGLLPVPGPEPAQDGSVEFTDRTGRHWTATLDAGAVRSWMMREEGTPVLWWKAEEAGGILSHREGVQFRWQQTVAEPVQEPFPALTAPDDYEDGGCDALVDS